MPIRRLALTLAGMLVASAANAAPSAAPVERGRVGFYSLAAPSEAEPSVVDRIAPYASGLAGPWLGADLVTVDAHGATDEEIAQTCGDARVNAIVVFFYGAKQTGDGASRSELAEAHLDVFDCYGDIAYDGAGTAEARIAARDAAAGAYAEARTATDRAFSALQSDARSAGTAVANLVRYGFPIRDGEKTAGLRLRAGPQGAIARPLKFGTAARAGLRRGDLITSLNGASLAGLDSAGIDAVVARAEAAGGTYIATVSSEDGKTATFAFASLDLAGYLRL